MVSECVPISATACHQNSFIHSFIHSSFIHQIKEELTKRILRTGTVIGNEDMRTWRELILKAPTEASHSRLFKEAIQ
jgi:hypothetical protein